MKNRKRIVPISDVKFALGQLRHCYGNWVRGGIKTPEFGLLNDVVRLLEVDETERYGIIVGRLREQAGALQAQSKKFDKQYLSETIEKLEREVDRG